MPHCVYVGDFVFVVVVAVAKASNDIMRSATNATILHRRM